MNTLRLLVSLCLACLVLPASAETAHTPKPGSAERKEICDALRAFIIQEHAEQKLPRPIVLKIEYLKVLGDYCVVECEPIFEDGTSAIGPYFPDIGYTHCLKRFANWHVINDLSRSDVPDPEEIAEIKKSFPGDFPMSLLPPDWKDQRIHSASWQARPLAPFFHRREADEAFGIVLGEGKDGCLHILE